MFRFTLLRASFVLSAIASSAHAQAVGVISTLAGATPAGGAPVRGYSGDGGPATSAALALADIEVTPACGSSFEQMSRVSVDRNGNVFIADSRNQRIRRVAADGSINTVVGSGSTPSPNARCEPTGGAAGAGDGGPAITARLFNPADVVFAPNGDMVVVDQFNNRIRRIDGAGNINTIVGSNLHAFYAPGAPATSSGMDWPSSAAYDSQGTLHFAELHSHRVARVASDGRLLTVAGTGFQGFSGDGGPAASAQLFNPAGIAFDSAGNLYIADQGNHRIRRVTPGGTITTFAGNGRPGFSGDGGPASSASLNQPTDVDVDQNGNVYIADMSNHRVRRVAPDGTISTVAGNGQIGRGADGIVATESSLNFPAGVATDAAGNLYIVDWQNYLIRKVAFGNFPAISSGGVVNWASGLPAPIPVAVGSIVSIYGVNLAPRLQISDTAQLPTEILGTSVTVNGRAAPIYGVSPGLVNIQVPYDIPAGPATAVIKTADGTTAAESFNVSVAAPGILSSGSRAVAFNQDGSFNSATNSEQRGNVLVLYGTGIGPVEPAVETGKPSSTTALSYAIQDVTATFGSENAEVLFAGLAPGFVGLSQFNIRIPANAPTGPDVPLTIRVGRQPSNTAAVAIR